MRKEELSIGYEIWARPEMGIHDCYMAEYGNKKWTKEVLNFCHEFWKPIEELSLIRDQKSYVIYKLAKRALNLPDDFAEFGCFKGGLSFMLGMMVRKARVSKHIYMHDNFDKGLPKPNKSLD